MENVHFPLVSAVISVRPAAWKRLIFISVYLRSSVVSHCFSDFLRWVPGIWVGIQMITWGIN
ncbi:MAG: hypothetical protein HY525_04355 [Betaproteobacteria bacterium]|nr:hypothetical protein [Betaproteobacteria bacterium]